MNKHSIESDGSGGRGGVGIHRGMMGTAMGGCCGRSGMPGSGEHGMETMEIEREAGRSMPESITALMMECIQLIISNNR